MPNSVARLAGALSDANGNPPELIAPVFELREFEHLEMEDPDGE
jgi:hypothetical protein